MKKLYALLIILIVIYVGINVSVNGFSITSPQTNDTEIISEIVFPSLDSNFTMTKVNNTSAKYVDNNNGVNILVQAINTTENLSTIYTNLVNGGLYTSSQQIDQNGVTAYFLYQEGAESYNTDIYFNKNGQNYKISGYNTTYENSAYFINHCKQIIDTI